MTEKMTQALDEQLEEIVDKLSDESEYHSDGDELLYFDTQIKEGAKMAIDWYRNNVWHPSAEPHKPKTILAVQPGGKGAYAGNSFTVPAGWLWAYLEDLFPDGIATR